MDYHRRGMRITRWALTGLLVLFFLNDALNMALQTAMARTGIADPLGIPHRLMPVIGTTLLVCLALFLVPATSRLGAILLTGYLGGAAATNLVLEHDLTLGVFGFLTATVVGVGVWATLWLHDPWARQSLAPPFSPAANHTANRTADPAASPTAQSRRPRVASLVLTILAALFFAFDITMHLAKESHAVAAANLMGMDLARLVVIGAIEAVCVLLFLLPRTSRLGTLLMTAYLGGASAVNLVTGQPAFNVVFAPLLGALMWFTRWLVDLWPRYVLVDPRKDAAPSTLHPA